MRTMFTVHHNEHVSSRSFEEVVNAFESAVGSVEDTGFAVLVASTKSAEEFQSQVNPARARAVSCASSPSIMAPG